MLCVTPPHTMQQDMCCLMSELEQARRNTSVLTGMVKQLEKDLSDKVCVSQYTVTSLVGCLFPSPSCPPLPSFFPPLRRAHPLNQLGVLGKRCELPAFFVRSQTAKRFMVQFELKVVPSVTQNQQYTSI